jgi:hypothetical protein
MEFRQPLLVALSVAVLPSGWPVTPPQGMLLPAPVLEISRLGCLWGVASLVFDACAKHSLCGGVCRQEYWSWMTEVGSRFKKRKRECDESALRLLLVLHQCSTAPPASGALNI